jgi:hypothetical protein
MRRDRHIPFDIHCNFIDKHSEFGWRNDKLLLSSFALVIVDFALSSSYSLVETTRYVYCQGETSLELRLLLLVVDVELVEFLFEQQFDCGLAYRL